MVRNTVKNMQFHLIVVSIFLKTCVRGHGESSSRLLERRVSLVCIESLLLVVLPSLTNWLSFHQGPIQTSLVGLGTPE